MRDSQNLDVYFNGDKTLFLIPLYQRRYAWQRKHCERLFNDLLKVYREGRRNHFFGSIVSMRADEVQDDLLIIDGQQRITTVSLLVLAAIKATKEGFITCESGEEYLRDKTKKYLFAPYRKGERKIKLRPIDKDCEAYDRLFDENAKPIPAEDSAITRNYLLFYEQIKRCGLTFEELIETLEKLTIIDIRLDSGDNPQLIFESLNSCGKDLEEADKVRNYLLMSLSHTQQVEFYHKYWSKIEDYTDEEPTMFIRDYLTVKRKIISNITELYFEFKDFDETAGMNREALLAEMTRFAKFYQQAAKGMTGNERIDLKFKHLANIGSTVCMPFYLNLLDFADTSGLSVDEVYKVLDTVENYWARRIICGYPANVMAKSFALLHSEVMKVFELHEQRGAEPPTSYSDVFNYVLLRKQGNSVFPDDFEVRKNFPERQIYRIPIDYRYFLFERMENEDSKEADETIVQRMKEDKISIEHIMPQTLTPAWETALGENWKTIHEAYLHTFGNLTLTGYNSSYGNHTFAEKKEGYIDRKGNKVYGFKDSAFRLSNYLKTCDEWTEKEICERTELLLNKFLHLWPMISSTYIPLEKEVDTVSLDDDDIELTGRYIAAFTFRGIRYPVSTWKDMLIQLCKLLYKENPTGMYSISSVDAWLHLKDGKDRSKIADDCYVWSSNSTKTKCSGIRYIFKNLNILPSELDFHLIPLNQSVQIEDED